MEYLRPLLPAPCRGLELDPTGYVLVTPRDQSSKYVVILFLGRDSGEPRLVAKISRLSEYDARLAREAQVLDAVQRARRGGFDTIPRVVALGRRYDHLVLLQSALVGTALDPATVRRRRADSVAAVLSWLEGLPAQPRAAAVEQQWFEKLVEAPLQRLSEALVEAHEPRLLVERTHELLEPLRGAELPLVLEHGDVSHPNLVRLRDGRVGVIDWELAELHGLPAHDLFFFLAYAAFAAGRAWGRRRQLDVFDQAFFRPGSWTHGAVARYAAAVKVDTSLLRPLFLACWARQAAGLVVRVEGAVPSIDLSRGRSRRLRRSMSVYIQGNAYYALWRHAVEHHDRLAAWADI